MSEPIKRRSRFWLWFWIIAFTALLTQSILVHGWWIRDLQRRVAELEQKK